MPNQAIDAVLEIFGWVGFGLGALLALIAIVMLLADGTWLPARAMIEESPNGRIARWFDADGGVGSAYLTLDIERALEGNDEADIFYRRGDSSRMRLTHGSPIVRGVFRLAAGLFAVGAISFAIAAIALFARG
ncbi:hypothetical protein ACWPKO_32340 (plasmid) [Coraliomargarita sp. W4R53]